MNVELKILSRFACHPSQEPIENYPRHVANDPKRVRQKWQYMDLNKGMTM